jgi:hypothetical protein
VAFLKPLAALQPDGLLAQWTAARARLYSKAFGAELLASFLRGHSSSLLCPGDVVGEVCADEAAATAAAARAAAAGASTGVVIKALYGQAGRGQLRLHTPQPGSAQAAWLRRTLASQGSVVVEARLDRAADLSLQLEIGAAEQTVPLGVTRFLTDPQGRFRGVLLPAAPTAGHGLAPAGGQVPPGLLDQVAVHVGDALRAHGYRGPAGVDMLLYRTPSGCRLKPIVEVNPRCTMGRLALHLARHLAPGVAGVWRLLANPEAAAAGYADAARLAAAAAARWPLVLSANAIREGVLFTNDPQRAGHFLSLLAVGQEPVRWLAATLRDPDLQAA